jgi:hypothetical protein
MVEDRERMSSATESKTNGKVEELDLLEEDDEFEEFTPESRSCSVPIPLSDRG